MAKRTKDELLKLVREHAGDEPDDFTISLLEDITDSMGDTNGDIETITAELNTSKENITKLTADLNDITEKYNGLKKTYADRFVLSDDTNDTKANDVKDDTPDTTEETYDSIFAD